VSSVWQFTDPSFTPLPGARALYGRLGGAEYEIEMPDHWNGGLVMYAHGFAGNEPFLIVGPPPLRAYFIQEGFAWAASSFRDNGYDPQSGVDDTLALLNYFKQNVAQPARTYIYGTSMGGQVVVSSLEQQPDIYQGAFSECGVVAGVEEMDYLLSYSAVGQYLAGLNLLPVNDISNYESAVRTKLIPALGNPTTKRLTPKGRAFESVIENLTGGPRPFRHEGFLDRFAADFTVTFDDLGGKTPAARAATNEGQQYTIAPGLGVTSQQLDAGVYRQPPDASVRDPKTNPALAPMTGNLHTPLLTIHTTGDAFVPFSLEQDYRRAVDVTGNGDMLVQRAIRRPDHCQFSDAEREQSWDDLVRWVDQGVKPDGDDVLSPDLSQIGLKWTNPLLSGDPGGL
jgi:pimeloyl-ACP methyl ester carboxylesterase